LEPVGGVRREVSEIPKNSFTFLVSRQVCWGCSASWTSCHFPSQRSIPLLSREMLAVAVIRSLRENKLQYKSS
jgi:hypothetical protein